MATSTLSDLSQNGIQISICDIARQKLAALCFEDLSNGPWRVERHLVNSLVRAVFDIAEVQDRRLTIADVKNIKKPVSFARLDEFRPPHS